MIQALREEAKIERTELALRAGVHHNTIINIESGNRASFATFNTIEKILDTLGYELEVMSKDGKKRIR